MCKGSLVSGDVTQMNADEGSVASARGLPFSRGFTGGNRGPVLKTKRYWALGLVSGFLKPARPGAEYSYEDVRGKGDR